MIAGMETTIADWPEFRWNLPKTATGTLLRRAAREPVPHEPDMFAEHVELIRKGERHLHCVDRILDVVEPLEHVFARLRHRTREAAALERYPEERGRA